MHYLCDGIQGLLARLKSTHFIGLYDEKIALMALTTMTLTALIGCGKSQETYTTDYLYANDDVRAKVLAECAENKQSDTNCKNANDADSRKKS